MSFSSENGYTPYTFNQLMDFVRLGVNSQFGTTYTTESFVGTNWYKYAYALVQKLQEGEVKTSEIFQKLQEYIRITNEAIQRPSVSYPGMIDAFAEEDYIATIKPPVEAEAGTIRIAVDVADTVAGVQAKGNFEITSYANLVSGTHDSVTVGATVFTAQATSVTPGGATFQAATSNSATALSLAAQINAHATAGLLVKARAFGQKVILSAIARGTAGNSIALDYTNGDANIGATKSGTVLSGGTAAATGYAAVKLAIATLISQFVAAGIPSLGTQTEDITLSNGQEFTFAFNLADRISVLLRLTLNASDNSLALIPTDEELRTMVFTNTDARYKLGYDFEPQRYFTLNDALWASDLVLEWSADGGTTWNSTVRDMDYDEVFDFDLEDISVVINA